MTPKVSPLDVALVCFFFTGALIGRYCNVLSTELTAAVITACLAFLAMRVKVLGTKDDAVPAPDKDKTADDHHAASQDDDAVAQPADHGHSHRILVNGSGKITVEDVDTPPNGVPPVDPGAKP